MNPKLACIALTPGGRETALRLAPVLAADVYLPARLGGPAARTFDGPLKDLFPRLFREYRGLVCIMATGIVVRMVAPLLESKACDPAVVVVDENVRYAISLLSGHLGGANRLAGEVAAVLGGEAVITTATDCVGREGLDLLAARLGLTVQPLTLLKRFNALLAAGDEVPVYGELPPKAAGEGYRVRPLAQWGGQAAVLVTERKFSNPDCLFLRPRVLVAGAGFRRGAAGEKIAAAVVAALDEGGFSSASLRALASVDLKRDDQGIWEAGEILGVPVEFYSRAEIETREGEFTPSPWVKKAIGVNGVCEPAALLAGRKARMVVSKRVYGGVTAAVARDGSPWWASDRVE